MPIFKGTLKTGAAYKGSASLSRIYKGVYLVFEAFKTLIAEGVPPITLLNCAAEIMLGYRIYGDSRQGKLPAGYTQLEYIQSTGTQYIDTGLTATDNTGIKIKYCYTASGSSAISGIFMSTSPRRDTLFISSNSGQTDSTLFCAHRGVTFTTSTDIALNTDYTCEINYLNSGEAYFGDTLLGNVGSNDVYNKTIPLFARYSVGGSNYAISNSRIYYAIFSEGNAISKHFIPAKRNSDNVLGMYDIINNEFKINAGTGTFTAGAVAPTPNAPIEIESVGDKTKNLWNSTIVSGCYRFNNGDYIQYPGYVCNATPIPVEPGETYTLSAKDYDDPYGAGFVFYNNGVFVSSSETNNLTITVPAGANQLCYDFRKSSSPNSLDHSDITNVQLEKSSSPTTYEPYGYKIPVTVTGKNICNPSSFINTGKLLSGTDGGLNTNTNYKTTDYIFIKAGTYTLSLDNTYDGTGATTTRMCLYNNSYGYTGNAISDSTVRPTHPSYTFTIANDCYYRLSVRNTDTNVQLEKSATETTYEAYTATTTNIYLNEPLRKIGDADAVNLPSGYTQLEYIATSSSDTVNAYIDTGVYANPNLRINTEVEFIAVKAQASIFRSGADFWSGVYLSNNLRFAYTYQDDAGNYTATSITAANSTRYNIDFDGQQKTLKINNDTITISGSPATKTSTKTLPLLGRIGGDGTSVYSDFYGKLYYAKIYDNGTLIRNLIPAKNSSNVIGMYDTVNGVFYQNAGTGTFTAGPEIYADYIDFETQKVIRNVGHIDLGSINWIYQSQNSRFIGGVPNIKTISGAWMYSLMCDIYGTTLAQNYNIGAQSVNAFVWDNRYSDPTTYTAAVKGHYLDYALNEATEETITLPDVLLNKGTNIISVGTTTQPSDMWIKYKGK